MIIIALCYHFLEVQPHISLGAHGTEFPGATIAFLFRLLDPKSPPASMEALPAASSPSPTAKPKEEPPGKEEALPVEERIVNSDQLQHDVLCGICCLLLTHPKQCLNGHVYCGDCMTKCVIKQIPCPTCRRAMAEDTIARNLYMEEFCSALPIHCRYHYQIQEDEAGSPSPQPAKDGCPQQIAHRDLENHERDCQFSWIRCPFTYKCGSVHRVRKNQWAAHREVCEFRPAICRYCDGSHPVNSLQEHEGSCPMYPIQCSKCKTTVPLRSLADHKHLQCLEETIACPFKAHGCAVQLPRKQLQDHLDAEQGNHLGQLQRSHSELLQAQRKLLERGLEDLRKQFTDMRESLATHYETEYTATWQVADFKAIKRRCFKRSKPFTIHGFEWFMGSYFYGDSDDSQDYLSVYLFCHAAPPQCKMTLRYTMNVVNHEDEQESVSKDFLITFPVASGQGWGDRKAIRHTTINSMPGFLNAAGALTLVCTARVVSVDVVV